MIVKLWNEVSNSWIYEDAVDTVEVDYNWVPYEEESGYIIFLDSSRNEDGELKINRQYSTVIGHNLISRKDKPENFFKCLDNEIYTVKTISLRRDDRYISYAVPRNADVFLMNNEGKTVERL